MPFEGAPWFLLLYFEWGKRWMPAGATEKCARGITYFFDSAVQVIECLAHACQICFEVHGRNLFQMTTVCDSSPTSRALPMFVRAGMVSFMLASVRFKKANPVF